MKAVGTDVAGEFENPPLDRAFPHEPIPGLTPQAELAAAVRILYEKGFDDHFFGHITFEQADGSILTTPWEVIWSEVRASDIVVMDARGIKVSGRRKVNPGVGLHLHVKHYSTGSQAAVVIHQHPRYATLWAAKRRIPPIYDQGSAWVGNEIFLVPEFEAGETMNRAYAEGICEAGWSLLANHGVIVVGTTLPEAVWRASVLEHRSFVAHELEGLGAEVLDPVVAADTARIGDMLVAQWWSTELHRQVARDPLVLS